MATTPRDEAIESTVENMRLGRIDAFGHDFERMAAATPFSRADIALAPIGFELWLHKPSVQPDRAARAG